MTEAEKKAHALAERIEKFATQDTPQKALAGMSEDQIVDFIRDYYTNDSLNFDDEVNKRAEEALMVVEKELESNSKPPYSNTLIEAMVNLGKMSVMDEVVDVFAKSTKTIQDSLKNQSITNPKAGMLYQQPLAEVMQTFAKVLSKELTNECKSRGLDADEFMKGAFQHIMTDPSIVFELDSFSGLKNYESVKDVAISEEQVNEFSKQVVAYTKLLLDGKVPEMSLFIYPSLMNQFLKIKFGIDSYQIIGKIIALLKEQDLKKHSALFRQLAEEIWYVENGRALIFSIIQQQMEMMNAMASQGMNPEQMMQGMDPAMLEALSQGKLPEGMDPAMMEALMKGGMPPMDPAMMEAMAKGEMPGFDPAMMEMLSKGGMPPFDPSMLGGMPGGQMPHFDIEAIKRENPAMAAAMEKGMEIGKKATQNMTEEQREQLLHALQTGDLAKMTELMPPDIKQMLDEAKKREEGQ